MMPTVPLSIGGTAQLVAVLVLVATSATAQMDSHDLFEARCTPCHGHAGAFARETLTLGADGLTGREGRPIGPFLAHHKGGLEDQEIANLLDMFAAQIRSGALFEDRCRICHDRAHDFARLNLIERDGRLFGRYSGRSVGPFLTGHGRLSESEAATMTDALREILRGGR